MKIHLKINGAARTLEVQPNEVLADAIRGLGLTGTKIGCREGNCGSCVVLLDGRPINSCLFLAVRAHNHEITTIEGLGSAVQPHPIQEAFVEAGAVQCGYCTPGMILSTKALLDRNPKPSREEIVSALDGNYCRCTGYQKIIDAVVLAAERLSQGDVSA